MTNLCPSDDSACNNGKSLSADGVVSVLLGDGDGTFQTAVTYDSGAGETSGVAIADVNGDGKPDLVIASVCGSGSDCSYSSVGVLLGNGDGTFKPAVTYRSVGHQFSSTQVPLIAAGDLNGDGKVDLVVTAQCAGPGFCTGGTVGVLIGNGDGTFQPAAIYASGGPYSTATEASSHRPCTTRVAIPAPWR